MPNRPRRPSPTSPRSSVGDWLASKRTSPDREDDDTDHDPNPTEQTLDQETRPATDDGSPVDEDDAATVNGDQRPEPTAVAAPPSREGRGVARAPRPPGPPGQASDPVETDTDRLALALDDEHPGAEPVWEDPEDTLGPELVQLAWDEVVPRESDGGGPTEDETGLLLQPTDPSIPPEHQPTDHGRGAPHPPRRSDGEETSTRWEPESRPLRLPTPESTAERVRPVEPSRRPIEEQSAADADTLRLQRAALLAGWPSEAVQDADADVVLPDPELAPMDTAPIAAPPQGTPRAPPPRTPAPARRTARPVRVDLVWVAIGTGSLFAVGALVLVVVGWVLLR